MWWWWISRIHYTGQCHQGYYTTSTSTLSLLPSDGLLAPHSPRKYLDQTLSLREIVKNKADCLLDAKSACHSFVNINC